LLNLNEVRSASRRSALLPRDLCSNNLKHHIHRQRRMANLLQIDQ
jgi:hypothetical protein